MIEGDQYLRLVGLFYSFLETEFHFKKVRETINGNAFYDVEYENENKIISVSYENLESHLEIIVFKLENGVRPSYDDKVRTIHLNVLNTSVISKVDKEELGINAEYFSEYTAKSEIERKLLKAAKELRLGLKHLII